MTERVKTTYVLMLEQLESNLRGRISEHVASSKVDDCLLPLSDFINDVYQNDKETSLVSRLSTLIKSLESQLKESPLNEDSQKSILSPLHGFLDDVAELAELDRVHQELSNKIIQPFEDAHKQSNRFSISFGIVGLISAVIGLSGFLLSINSEDKQQALLDTISQFSSEVKDHNSGILKQAQATLKEEAKNNKNDIIDVVSTDILSVKTLISNNYSNQGTFSTGIAREQGIGTGARLSENPFEDYLISTEKGDIQGAKDALKTMINIGAPSRIQLASALGILHYGDGETLEITKRIWYSHKEQFSSTEHQGTLSAVTHYAQKVDQEKANAPFIEDVSKYLVSNTDNQEDKAFAYNQLGKIYYGLDINKAKEHTLKALKFSPDDTSYLHNLSMIYERSGDYSQALHYSEQSFSKRDVDDPDADHISQYIDVLLKLIDVDSPSESNGEHTEKVRELYVLLKEVDPREALLSLIKNDGLKDIVELEQ
ncbi:hypothetical protein PRUB_a1077 [Pseudoalteromonas rubra]|uniref:Tetratricopeptide repeat protein n=1 Tax=Pseudoalteromonas rubra TaxID=43658 RepID=A0A8T0C7A0_9GAMM|nr:hypothetical protein [Pseudoalteromonas rubra]KAF7786490.1 hypothetical protein PRUB_a1077 [Pseudoalteromonas rubra]